MSNILNIQKKICDSLSDCETFGYIINGDHFVFLLAKLNIMTSANSPCIKEY